MWVKCVAAYSQINTAELLWTHAVGHGQQCYGSFIAKHETSHVSQLHDPNFSGDASSRSEVFRGLHEARTRRPKLKTQGCTNLGRQVTDTKNSFFWGGGVEPNIYEFSVRELLRAGVLGPRNSEFGSMYLEKCLHTSIRRIPLRVTPLPLHCSPSPCHPTLHCLRRRRCHYANQQINRRQQ